MSNFVELNNQEKEAINGGIDDFLMSVINWLGHLLGLDDPDHRPLLP